MPTTKPIDAIRTNALRSGLHAESSAIPGESAEDFAQLQSDYLHLYAPATPTERFQVDQLIRNEWLLRRYHRVEEQLWAIQFQKVQKAGGCELAEAFLSGSSSFMRLKRYIAHAEKAYKDALASLTALQKPAPQPAEPMDLDDQLASLSQTAPATFVDLNLPNPIPRKALPLKLRNPKLIAECR